MLSKEERAKKISYSNHTLQALHDRGKILFPHCSCVKEIYVECIESLQNPQKSVIFPDDRSGVSSSHYVMFVNDAGETVALPVKINEHDIHIFTIKDVKQDFNNPNWFIEKYNNIATQRGMDKLPLVIKIR